MAQQSCVVKGGEGISYQGLRRSEEQNFRLNGLDTFIKVVDENGTASAASVDIETGLKKVLAAKVIVVSQGTGNAITHIDIYLGDNGLVTIGGLDSELTGSDVYILVAIGSRV
jgi:hypothetical protein